MLEAIGLEKTFHQAGREVRAVRGVSLSVAPGRTLGLVGESGSGKTTVARCILRLIEPDAGRVLFRGRDVARLRPAELRAVRREMQIVFQSPRLALDAAMTAGQLVGEGLRVHRLCGRKEQTRRTAEALEAVGLSQDLADRYPHELSGGQLQRVAIARAIVLRPGLVVLDEPVSALDVSVRAGVLNLLKDLQRDLGLSYLMIGHDLATVRFLSHEIAVMYAGRIVERAPPDVLFERPLHPYSRLLIASVPEPDPEAALSPPSDLSSRDYGDAPLVEVEPGHWVAAAR